jgi:hypothetical protein
MRFSKSSTKSNFFEELMHTPRKQKVLQHTPYHCISRSLEKKSKINRRKEIKDQNRNK